MRKFFSNIQQVFLNDSIVATARKFSKAVISTINYSDSNQFFTEKIIDDHFISKLGEEAAKIVLMRYAIVKGPDYTIYEAKRKSWDDDIYVDDIGVAVKTQKRSIAKRFGLSWTFQAGPNRRDSILDNPDAWIILVEYNDNDSYECFVYPPFQLKELILGEPKLNRLKNFKKVVYAESLPM